MTRKSLCWSYLSKNKNNGVRVHYDFAKSILTPFFALNSIKIAGFVIFFIFQCIEFYVSDF